MPKDKYRRMAEQMTTRKVRKLVRDIGMSISSDGLAFTVCGEQLVNGDDAPDWIAELNGSDCFEVVKEILRRKAV
jgi:hypothetical protein